MNHTPLTGRAFILFTMVITLNLYLMSKPNPAALTQNSWLTVSQVSALYGTLFMSLSVILAARPRFLESWFGGLDKVYKSHHLFGGIALVLLLQHPLTLIINALPNYQMAFLYLFPVTNLAYSAGILALWILIILLVATLYLKLPYHIWKITHNFMGIVVLLAALHIYLIPSDVSRYLPLRFWMMGLIGLALFAAFYQRFLYRFLGPRYAYRLMAKIKLANCHLLYLKPIKQGLSFQPGQFVFASIRSHRTLKESHPFSIASEPGKPYLRLIIKELGDYTSDLHHAHPSDLVYLWGPYGRFLSKPVKLNQPLVGIGGGIGITPFLSLARSKVNQTSPASPVYLYYSVSQITDALGHRELTALDKYLPNLSYRLHVSRDQGRLTAKMIITAVPEWQSANYYICGPLKMMLDLRSQLLGQGVKPAHIIYEDFSLK